MMKVKKKLKEAELIHKYIDEHGERPWEELITDSRTLWYAIWLEDYISALLANLVEMAKKSKKFEIVAPSYRWTK